MCPAGTAITPDTLSNVPGRDCNVVGTLSNVLGRGCKGVGRQCNGPGRHCKSVGTLSNVTGRDCKSVGRECNANGRTCNANGRKCRAGIAIGTVRRSANLLGGPQPRNARETGDWSGARFSAASRTKTRKKADKTVASPCCFSFGAEAPATEVGATRNSPCRSWRVMARPFGRAISTSPSE
jgi:hypothetical protein